MKKFIVGFVLGLIIAVGINVFAYRIQNPPNIYSEQDFTALNNFLDEIWKVTDGRYNLDVVTVNPDGNTKGDTGDMLLYNNSGTFYLEINTNSTTVWRGVQLTDTP